MPSHFCGGLALLWFSISMLFYAVQGHTAMRYLATYLTFQEIVLVFITFYCIYCTYFYRMYIQLCPVL